MNELTVRFESPQRPIDPEFLIRLESVAAEYGVSIDPSSRKTIEEAALRKKRKVAEFIRKANEFAGRLSPQTIDSTDLIREDRECL